MDCSTDTLNSKRRCEADKTDSNLSEHEPLGNGVGAALAALLDNVELDIAAAPLAAALENGTNAVSRYWLVNTAGKAKLLVNSRAAQAATNGVLPA